MSPEIQSRPVPIRTIAIVFGVLFALLAAGYYAFLRADYVPVFSQLRPVETSAIAAQLDAKKLSYRLADNGTAILVPEDDADKARVAVAGSDFAAKGAVGFELFNKSDMGLTDFAQKINYQRALQGELERTIMTMDGVESARVHLAMPERSLFRAEKTSAKAAVEIVTAPGKLFDEARVQGLQRLVAFSVPDLAAEDVVILDGHGRVVSATVQPSIATTTAGDEQRLAVERYYGARARAAIEQLLPELRFDVRVLATTPATTNEAATGADARRDGARRDFTLRLTIATAAGLSEEQQHTLRGAVAAAVALDPENKDEIVFQVGLGPAYTAAPVYAQAPAARPMDAAQTAQTERSPVLWPYILGALAIAAVTIVLVRRQRHVRIRLTEAERNVFVERLRTALHDEDDARYAG